MMRALDQLHRGLAAIMLAILAVAAGAVPAEAAEPAPTIVILDGSGSMWGVAGRERKLAVARRAVDKAAAQIPPGRTVGLMAYGHRRKSDCGDIELLVPPAPGSGPAIRKALQSMHFLGMTPLSAAVREAAEALRYKQGPATVVLITDGIETCDDTPCVAAADLKRAGADFTVHVIGFSLSREEGAQVACIARNTGGRYIEARDAASLDRALGETLLAPPSQ